MGKTQSVRGTAMYVALTSFLKFRICFRNYLCIVKALRVSIYFVHGKEMSWGKEFFFLFLKYASIS